MDKPVTVPDILLAKGGRKLTMLTAADASLARLVDQAGADMVLVGDSLAMVALGHDDTLGVGLETMLLFTRAVSSAVTRALVVGDMPFLSYQPSDEMAVISAGRFLAEGKASAVKVEGGARMLPRIRAMLAADIPVMGHIGLTPQSLARMGGFKVQAKTAEAARILRDDALALAEAGCFAMVLEGIPGEVARIVTEAVPVPTIGIGAGPHCDGQVLVTHDVLGLFERFTPKFVKRYANLSQTVRDALAAFKSDVEAGAFPGPEHTFRLKDEERAKLAE
ncbi:MAG: 3-methyl-2-oxobutanoate hydroxymethyltransferase [Thermodesulfobacteriota bacterium]